MENYTIIFITQGRSVEVSAPAGSNLLQVAAVAGIPIEGNCGGKGTCNKCRVKIKSDSRQLPTAVEMKHFSREKLAGGEALACQRTVSEDMVVEVQYRKDVDFRKVHLEKNSLLDELNPCTRKVYVELVPPTLKDQTPDLERLLEALSGNIKVSCRVISGLPRILRESGFRVTAVLVGERLAAVEPGDTTGRKFGIAFDIGTTTVVGYLVDFGSGRVLAASATGNPQKVYGADVISRINHASVGPEGLKQLQDKVVSAINDIINRLLAENGVKAQEVYEAAVVGNTTMSHLFLGIDPTYLAPAPFIPAFRQPVEVSPGELGLNIHPAGRVHVLPNISGYVGSDTVGMMLAARLDRREGICLALDMGTNGELVLVGRGRILTCSTAAGPAFEGAQIKDGMRAAEGAIEAVQIKEDGEVHLKVIGKAVPHGICGSGLIDAVAQLLKVGIINRSGRIQEPGKGVKLHSRLESRIRKGDGGYEFVLAPGNDSSGGDDIVITQKDVRELQLAKGAILAGIRVLLLEMGITPDSITEILLAGAFGNYIKKESALAIGLLPEVPPHRIISVGNAAGEGAVLALMSKAEQERAFSLVRVAEYMELSGRQDFQNEFVDALYFPKADL